jgi:hypothetical protein
MMKAVITLILLAGFLSCAAPETMEFQNGRWREKYRDYAIADTSGNPLEYSFAWNPPRNIFGTPYNEFSYTLPETCVVKIEIFDANQEPVESFKIGKREPGSYRLEWSGASFRPSGIYFVKLDACEFDKTVKYVLLK